MRIESTRPSHIARIGAGCRLSRDLANRKISRRSLFETQGVYLITGGLGGIGLVLAESIAKSVRARLVLVGRSAFPPRESWDEWLNSHGDHDDATARQIRKIRAIENAGAEVMVVTGDVCDPEGDATNRGSGPRAIRSDQRDHSRGRRSGRCSDVAEGSDERSARTRAEGPRHARARVGISAGAPSISSS